MECGQARLNKREKLTIGVAGFLQAGLIAGKLGGTLPWHWALVLLPAELVVAIFAWIFIVAGFRIILEDE